MSIEAMKQALEVLKSSRFTKVTEATELIEQAIAEAEKQERFFCERCGKRLSGGIHICTPPTKKQTQGENT